MGPPDRGPGGGRAGAGAGGRRGGRGRGAAMAGAAAGARRGAGAGAGARGGAAVARARKVVTFQDDWRKEFVSTGVFVEAKDERKRSFNLLKALEGAGALSTTEQLKVLSTLEKSGLSLSKIEELGLLSTAEKLGALSLLEKVSQTDGATVASFGIPFFLAAIAVVSLVPDDTTLQVVGQYSAAGLFLGIFGAFFIGGNILKGLQLDYYSKN